MLSESEKKVLRRRFLESLTIERIEELYRFAVKLYDKYPSFRTKTHEMVRRMNAD